MSNEIAEGPVDKGTPRPAVMIIRELKCVVSSPRKHRLQNDLLCVGWNVKPYSLTAILVNYAVFLVSTLRRQFVTLVALRHLINRRVVTIITR